MKSRALTCIAFLLLAVSCVYARPWTPDDDIINGIPVAGAFNITSQTLGIGHLKIHISNPVVKMEQVDLSKRTWTMVTIDGETRLWANGKPALPLISRAIRLPNTGDIQLIVTPGEYDEYTNIDVLPQQPTDLKKGENGLEPADYTYDAEAYSKDAWYPSDVAMVSSPEIIRDARVALLGVQPVIYNPVTRTLRVYKSIDVETLPIGGASVNEIHDTRSHAVPSFAGIYSDIIGAEDLFDDARRAPPGQILFITRAGVDTLIKPFVNWKIQSGRPSQIYVTTATTTTPIQTYIQNAYSTMNPPLEFVLFMADGGTTTAEYELPTFSISGYTDHPYGVLGTGLVASIWVSRLHVDNDQGLLTQVNRSLNYERTPNMGVTGTDTAWFNKGWGYAGTANNIISNPPCIRFCLAMMNERGIMNTMYDEHNGAVSTSTIEARLTPGAIFWAHRASWQYEITATNVQNIQNINKPFVGFNISCSTGNWYGSTADGMHVAVTSLGTPTAPRGALSSVSTYSAGTNPAHNNVMAAGSFYGFGVKNARQPAGMYYEAKYQMWRNYQLSTQGDAANFIYWNEILGEISANIWTGVPQHVTATIPDTIGIGMNRMVLQIMHGSSPVVGAMVTAWKKTAGGTDETYTRVISDDSGRVVLTLTNTSAGTMLLTVTGNQLAQNIYPLIDTVQVVQTATDLAFSSYSVQDDTTNGRVGNNNATANPGETFDMTVVLRNRGTIAATGISGTLVSNDSRVTITNATRSWGNDSAGTTVPSTLPFRVQLASTFHDNDQVPLQLNLTTTQGNRTITVPLTVRSIQVAYISQTTNPSVVQPGQTATLSLTVRNNGGLATGATTVNLFSLSPFVSVTIPTATFTNLPIGSNVSNPAGQLFGISANGRTIPGTIANMGATFTAGAIRDTTYFSVTIGNRTTRDPAGPDPYGYLAFDITDTSYHTISPTYNWVELIPALAGNGTRLSITGAQNVDLSTTLRLPFTARYYGAAYDSVTICTSGWLAFGAQPFYQNSRNWHLPAQEGPRNIVAVNWCMQSEGGSNEGVYVRSDTATHSYIVTWKSTTVNSPMAQEYQLIIYDPAFQQTPTGDSPLKFQYKSFTPTQFSTSYEPGMNYCTIGIADSNYTRALEYCFWNVYNPGCAIIPVSNGSPTSNFAILFTTTQPATGNLTGTVRRASDNTAMSGVNVLMLNGGRNAVTDASGHYTMSDLQIGSYRVQASSFGFNTKIDTTVIQDSTTTTLDFSLTAPGLRVTLHPQDTTLATNDSISTDLLDSGQVARFPIYIRNTGNGPLTWTSQLLYGGNFDELDSTWDEVYSFNATQSCSGDQRLNGVEFDGAHFWVSGSNNYAYPHHLYKLDRTGELLATYNCPDTVGMFGWHDLAWDGHRYLYASYSSFIDKIDTATGQVVQRYVTPINPVRAIAVDSAQGVIYYADQASIIRKMRISDGAVIANLPNPSGGGLYALAWYASDPDGMKLYAFVRDSVTHTAGTRIYKIDPVTGNSMSIRSIGQPNENASGLAITPRWNPMLWTAVSLVQTNTSSRIFLNELAFNTVWIAYGPHSDTLQPTESDTVMVNLNSAYMPDGRYRVAVRFFTNSTTQTVTIPVVMNVVDTIITAVTIRETTLPKQFSLEQNYPNPFNPVTTISFALPNASPVRMTIHDALGREVAQLVSERSLPAGRHSISFDGSRLASGVYFYQLKAGNFSATRKMVLLK